MSKAKYVPILKWKRGERIALRNLTDDVKNLIRPVLTVTRNTEPDSYCTGVVRNWGISREFYLDFHPEFTGNHTEFLEAVINDEESDQLSIIPIITMNSSLDFISFIENNNNDKFRNGLALRIRPSNPRTIQEWFNSINQIISNSESIDLIIDTGDIGHFPNDSLNMFRDLIMEVIRNLQQYSFRHIIVAGASFPESINARQNNISSLTRMEWLLWKNINDEMPYVLFGDYGADDPQDPQYDSGITIVPTIRYTHENSWYIVRGIHDPRAPRDYTQYHELARRLIQQNRIYCGADFSWGDARIYNIANTTCTINNCNHGNPESWVQIGTNHHLTYVAHQVNQAVVF